MGVRGPIGAARKSLKRIGWAFTSPLTVRSEDGVEFPLTSTSPALLSYHLQVAWKKTVGTAAARPVGAHEGAQLDTTQYQKAIKELGPHHASLLRAYCTQAVWSNSRLYSYCFDAEPHCQYCGATQDSLYHRLWECGYSESIRTDFFTESDLDRLGVHPGSHELAQGWQIMPYLPDTRPESMGHEPGSYESWTISGGPLEDYLQGVVFTDGSCFKPGPVSWNREGWAVVELSSDVFFGLGPGGCTKDSPPPPPQPRALQVLQR